MLVDKGNSIRCPLDLADELGVCPDFDKSAYLDDEGRLFSCVGKQFDIAQFSQDGSLIFMPADKPKNCVIAQEIRLDSDK